MLDAIPHVRWFGQRFFVRPSARKSRSNRSLSDRKYFSPLCNAKSFTVKSQQSVIAPVTCLLFWRGPFYIARFVSLVVVNSLDCMFRAWPHPDMVMEGNKVVDPFLVHGDSTSAVSFISVSGWRQTSQFDMRPNIVFRAFCHTVSYDGFGWHVSSPLRNVLARLIGLQPVGPFSIIPQGRCCA